MAIAAAAVEMTRRSLIRKPNPKPTGETTLAPANGENVTGAGGLSAAQRPIPPAAPGRFRRFRRRLASGLGYLVRRLGGAVPIFNALGFDPAFRGLRKLAAGDNCQRRFFRRRYFPIRAGQAFLSKTRLNKTCIAGAGLMPGFKRRGLRIRMGPIGLVATPSAPAATPAAPAPS